MIVTDARGAVLCPAGIATDTRKVGQWEVQRLRLDRSGQNRDGFSVDPAANRIPSGVCGRSFSNAFGTVRHVRVLYVHRLVTFVNSFWCVLLPWTFSK